MTTSKPNPIDLIRGPIADELAQAARIFDEELASEYEFVTGLCRHVARYRGKMLRPTLVLLAGKACGGLRPEHARLAAVLEMIHVATLVHDDILDEADIRRQNATVNRMTSNEAAVLLGDYLISHAYHLCSSIGDVRVSRRVAAATNRVCEGELMQVHHRGDLALSEESYYAIVRGKTAELTRAACELGAQLAGADESVTCAMSGFGEDIGIAFQIVDDLLDLTADEAQTGKSTGRDAKLGKLTLPVIAALKNANAEQRATLQTLLMQTSENHAIAEHALANRGEATGIAAAAQAAAEAIAAGRKAGSVDGIANAAAQAAQTSVTSSAPSAVGAVSGGTATARQRALRTLLAETGGIAAAERAAADLISRAVKRLECLADNDATRALRMAAEFVVMRRN